MAIEPSIYPSEPNPSPAPSYPSVPQFQSTIINLQSKISNLQSKIQNPMSPSPSSPRKRGAPPGNRNALKHGYYSRKYKKAGLTGNSQASPIDLADEITLIRLNIRHLLELGLNAEDLNEGIQILRVVSLGASTLSRLIRTQHLISPVEDEFSLALKEALTQAQFELGITKDQLS